MRSLAHSLKHLGYLVEYDDRCTEDNLLTSKNYFFSLVLPDQKETDTWPAKL